MSTKRILVLCENLEYFHKWGNSIMKWHNLVADKRTRDTLQITTSKGTTKYTAFTPNMGKETLLGLRFHQIIDNIGLSDNEMMWFNILVRR